MKRATLLCLLLTGCASLEQTVIKQAAFDTKCPEEKIKVIAFGPNLTSAEVNACGTTHRYQDLRVASMDAPAEPNWVQVK